MPLVCDATKYSNLTHEGGTVIVIEFSQHNERNEAIPLAWYDDPDLRATTAIRTYNRLT